MRALLLVGVLLVSSCATSDTEEPLTAKQRAEFLAALPEDEREAFETLIWAREVDQRPIVASFDACVEREIGAAPATTAAAIVANATVKACWPIVDRLVRGIAMRVPALMTGPTADHLNSWANEQAAEQRTELLAKLTQRIETARAATSPSQ